MVREFSFIFQFSTAPPIVRPYLQDVNMTVFSDRRTVGRQKDTKQRQKQKIFM